MPSRNRGSAYCNFSDPGISRSIYVHRANRVSTVCFQSLDRRLAGNRLSSSVFLPCTAYGLRSLFRLLIRGRCKRMERANRIPQPSPRVFGVKIRCDVFGRRARSQYTVDCRFFLDGNVPAIRRTECRIRPFSNFSILDVGRCLLQQHISIQCVVLASHSRNLRASRLHSPLFITYFGKPLDRTMFFSFYMYNSYIYFWNRIDCLAVASIVHAPRPAAMGFKI